MSRPRRYLPRKRTIRSRTFPEKKYLNFIIRPYIGNFINRPYIGNFINRPYIGNFKIRPYIGNFINRPYIGNFIIRPYIGNFMTLCDHKPSTLDVFKVNFEIFMTNIKLL